MKTDALQLAAELAVPVDIATEAVAWIGARGAGKTHGAGKLVELLHGQGVPVVILDPVGVWYGLRLARDGKGPGLKIPVFGGLHGDLPLEPTAGALVADTIADRRLSAVLDVSQFESDAQVARFAGDLAERLFARVKKSPFVVQLYVDEAQEFVPQNPQPGEQMMLHRFQRCAKLGRNFGMGICLLTQRPQEVSKKVLNQCQTVLAFRLTGPQERKAMKEWIAAHDLDQTLVEKLPGLPTGTCHVWSPAFLKVSKEVRILPKKTFDASATPKFGEHRAAHELAPIDLEQLRTAMQATIEKAQANDPAALRRRVAELERQAAQRKPEPAPPAARVEVPVLKPKEVADLEKIVARLEKVAADALAGATYIGGHLAEAAAKKRLAPPLSPPPLSGRHHPANQAPTPKAPLRREQLAGDGTGDLTPAQARIVNALAEYSARGVDAPTRAQVAFLADASPNGGSFKNNLGALHTSGLVEYPGPDLVAITPAGLSFARTGACSTTTAEVHAMAMGKLVPARRRILEALLRVYPQELARSALADLAGASMDGGSFKNNLGAMRSAGLLDYPTKGTVRACDALFLEAAA